MPMALECDIDLVMHGFGAKSELVEQPRRGEIDLGIHTQHNVAFVARRALRAHAALPYTWPR